MTKPKPSTKTKTPKNAPRAPAPVAPGAGAVPAAPAAALVDATAPIDDDAVIAAVLIELQAGLKVLAARRAELPKGDFDAELCASTAAIAKAALVALAERRQRAKSRRRELDSFTDDELVERIKALPDHRREGVLVAAQGEDLAGKPLF